MNTKKLVLLTIVIIAAMICLGYVGLQSFGKKLYNSRDCDWGNIDNIELHTRTNIPATKSTDCSYDTILKAKKVIFTLDKNNMDMQEYISENKFTKAVSKEALPLKDIIPFESNPIAFDNVQNIYYKKESHYGMILDSKSCKLWVYLTYED